MRKQRFSLVGRWAGLFAALCVLALAGLIWAASPAYAGAPTFGDPRPFGTSTDKTESVAVGDLDGDGDLDIATGNAGQNVVYLNDGAGNFDWPGSSRNFGSGSDTTTGVAVGDVDADGALDLVVGNMEEQDVVYLNDGAGNFDWPGAARNFGTALDPTTSLAVGDLDGDGALDIAVGNLAQQNVVYLNDGGGNFDWPGSSRNFGTGSDITRGVAAGDVDGDGNIDIAVGNANLCYPCPGEPNVVYLNDGVGNFSTARNFGTGSDWTHTIAVGDVDGDGDLDFAVGNYMWLVGQGRQNTVSLNDGAGNFTTDNFGAANDNTAALAVGDLNDDGALDIIVGNEGQQNVAYINDQAGDFFVSSEFALGRIRDAALGDVDGDGDLDTIMGGWFYAPPSYTGSSVYLNDGDGVFTPSLRFAPGAVRSIVLGDVDRDSDLDVAVGRTGQNIIYLNDGLGNFYTGTVDCSAPPPNARCFGTGSDATRSLALGDVDGDGDLDLAAGNAGQNAIYLNDGAANFDLAHSVGPGWGKSYSVALGDVDGDGDLDLAAGNRGQQNAVYLNDGGGNFAISHSFGPPFDATYSVAMGDMDGDGDLDLAVGNKQAQNVLYLNDGAGNFDWPGAARHFGTGFDLTESVAAGDLDGDGDIDLLVGNGGLTEYYEQNVAYLNDGAGNLVGVRELEWEDWTTSVALGDLNGDGTLDIVAADANDWLITCSMVHLNRIRLPERLANNPPYIAVTRPGAVPGAGFYSSPEIVDTRTIPITYTLFDGEGEAVRFIRAFYSPDGGGRWLPAVAATGTVTTNLSTSPTGVDHVFTWDTFASGLFGQSDNIVLRIEAYPRLRPYTGTVAGPYQWPYAAATTFPFRVRGTQIRVLSGTGPISDALVYRLPAGQTRGGEAIADGAGRPYRTDAHGYLQGRGELGFGDRLVALAPISSSLEHPYLGFDGLDDYVEITGVQAITTAITVEAWARHDDAGNNGHVVNRGGSGSESGYALSWRGDDIRVELQDAVLGAKVSVENPAPADGAWHHLAFTWDDGADTVKTYIDGQLQPTTAIFTGSVGVPTLTLNLGRNELRGGYFYGGLRQVYLWNVARTQAEIQEDMANPPTGVEAGLVGGWPLDEGAGGVVLDLTEHAYDGVLQGASWEGEERYTLYYTNARPNLRGLEAYTVTTPGVQTLTVAAENPLVLFNLDVSLEWDARNDAQYMAQLLFDLQRTSEFLYDWTNGQAALGKVTVYHDREGWLDAHIRVYVSNRVRPNAAQGGIITDLLSDTDVVSITYAPGQVHMGAIWNRYGEPGGGMGADWPRTLAHELGHFALFLDDNYIGLDEEGLLIPVEGCPGAMSDPYREDYPYDEFHPAADWLPACERTLSHQTTGRSDWETIETYYPALGVYGTITNTGPNGLPLEVTEIDVVEPITPPDTLEDPTFYLTHDGGRVQPGTGARAFLFQGSRLSDLGRPTLDYVLARGARVGERLCVYEIDAGRLGCEMISEGDEQVELYALPDWQPDIVIAPVNSRTIALTVTHVPAGLFMEAQLFPVSDPALAAISLTETADGYTGTLFAEEPALAGFVHVWVDEAAPRREIVTDYSMGGNPGYIRGRGGYMRGRGGYIRGRGAPAMSADGQVILFGEDLDFDEGEFYTLQAATVLPEALPWATLIGRGYRLSASPNAPDIAEASVSFSYMGDEVPPGEEAWLRMYYWHEGAWQRLPTIVEPYTNYVSAPAQGEGLYLLMSSIEIPLEAGWNNLAYPIAGTRPVTEALRSISGTYGLVYSYDQGDLEDPWKVYAVGAPTWVNDLAELAFGRGYWISTTEAITLYLKGGYEEGPSGLGFPFPPATYYGPVLSGACFTPTAGMTVTAWVEGQACGRAHTLDVGGEVVYVIAVPADDEVAGCGAPGRDLSFQVGGCVMTPTVGWSNERLWAVALGPVDRPEALDDAVVTVEDSAALVDVLANDGDPWGEGLEVVGVGDPAHGIVAISGTVLLYTPALNYNGSDTFDYAIRGLTGLTDTAVVWVEVTPVNDAPEAADDLITVTGAVSVTVDVLANDYDPDAGDTLCVVQVGWPAYGSATTDGSTVTYTPTVGFVGTDQFVYVAGDGLLMDVAAVTVAVDTPAPYRLYLPLILK